MHEQFAKKSRLVSGKREHGIAFTTSADPLVCYDESSTGYNSPYNTCAGIVNYCSGSYGFDMTCPVTCGTCDQLTFEFSGTRNVRMVNLIGELTDAKPTYLGSTQADREAMAVREPRPSARRAPPYGCTPPIASLYNTPPPLPPHAPPPHKYASATQTRLHASPGE